MSDAPASTDDFQTLLRLQDHDTVIDQLEHRRSHLPGLATLDDIQLRAGKLRADLAAATAARDEAAGRQASLEAEVSANEARVAEINARLYGTTPVGSKDATAMLEEIKHLNERRSALEDTELEVMEALEPLEAEVARLQSVAGALSGEMKVAQADVAAAQADIDAELGGERTVRATLASGVPTALLSEYERLRVKLGGVAAAPIVAGSCAGCHIAISPTELAQIKKAPSETVVHCDECGRILVR